MIERCDNRWVNVRRPFATGVAAACLALLIASTPAAANRAPGPTPIKQILGLASAGSRVVFEGEAGVAGESGVWLERFGSQRPTRIASQFSFCPYSDELDELALGPGGTVACLETEAQGDTEVSFDVYVLLANGTKRHIVSYTGNSDVPFSMSEGVNSLFGDGHFLGYLFVTPDQVVELFSITASGHPQFVADLNGLSCAELACGDVSVDSGHIAIHTFGNGNVYVYTTGGEYVATIAADAVPHGNPLAGTFVAIRKNRVLALTAAGQLVVYTLQGALVHSYPAPPPNRCLATYYGYAAYISADKAVRVIKLSNGRSALFAHLRRGAFWHDLSFQAPGIVVPLGLTSRPRLVFVSMAEIRRKLG